MEHDNKEKHKTSLQYVSKWASINTGAKMFVDLCNGWERHGGANYSFKACRLQFLYFKPQECDGIDPHTGWPLSV